MSLDDITRGDQLTLFKMNKSGLYPVIRTSDYDFIFYTRTDRTLVYARKDDYNNFEIKEVVTLP